MRPDRARSTLEALRRSGLVETVPNLWQVELGVVRMLHRIVFRPDTIGTAVAAPVRDDPWARLLRNRLLRLPFLLHEGSVAPWDLSGLASGPDRIERTSAARGLIASRARERSGGSERPAAPGIASSALRPGRPCRFRR